MSSYQNVAISRQLESGDGPISTTAVDRDTDTFELRNLSENAGTILHELGVTLVAAFGGPSNPRCQRAIASFAANFDGQLRAVAQPPSTRSGACVLRGFVVNDEGLGKTPPIWSATDSAASLPLDLQLLLIANMLGWPFAWQGQQEGRLVNNVVPARGYEAVQTGASSSTLLSPHTEDAFHPHRSHALLLLCLRNPDRVATTISSVRHVELSTEDRKTLSCPTIPIYPDLTYGELTQWGESQPIPTLWNRPDGVCLRYDPDYTPWADAPPRYRAAYERLTRELQRVRQDLVLEPGDLAIIDNDVVVHGRVPFKARFDGTDRWLKRVNIAMPDRPRPASEQTESGYGQQINYFGADIR
jgi:L-asparagine oxygenase